MLGKLLDLSQLRDPEDGTLNGHGEVIDNSLPVTLVPVFDPLELMEQEFGGGIPNARVMISNVTIPQALTSRSVI